MNERLGYMHETVHFFREIKERSINLIILIKIHNLITSNNSVGNGPSPTLVVYAFTTPITSPIDEGGNPKPVHTPPILQFDDVTYG